MFHRVMPAEPRRPFDPTRGLAVTTEVFRMIIKSLRSSGYEFVSMDEAHHRIATGKTSRRFVCITLDDGYRDNCEIAYPICAELGVPMTVYITTGFIDGATPVRWYCLANLNAHLDAVTFIYREREYAFATESTAEKYRAYHAMEDLLRSLASDELAALMARFEHAYGIDIAKPPAGLLMTWDMVRDLSGRPGVEIGAHTLTHPRLSELSVEEAEHEIGESRRILEERIGHPVRHFAYPYGNPDTVGPREFGICRRLGFATGVTTRYDNLYANSWEAFDRLPRLTVNSFDTGHTVAAKASGVSSAMRNLYRRLRPR